jgi:hypothetical protein
VALQPALVLRVINQSLRHTLNLSLTTTFLVNHRAASPVQGLHCTLIGVRIPNRDAATTGVTHQRQTPINYILLLA